LNTAFALALDPQPPTLETPYAPPP
jgi:hypothetical protein